MATHFSTLAWKNPMDGGAWWAAVHGVSKTRTQLSDFTFIFTFMHWRKKWQPTTVFSPGESQGWRSLTSIRQLQRFPENTITSLEECGVQCFKRRRCLTPLENRQESQYPCGNWKASREAVLELGIKSACIFPDSSRLTLVLLPCAPVDLSTA